MGRRIVIGASGRRKLRRKPTWLEPLLLVMFCIALTACQAIIG